MDDHDQAQGGRIRPPWRGQDDAQSPNDAQALSPLLNGSLIDDPDAFFDPSQDDEFFDVAEAEQDHDVPPAAEPVEEGPAPINTVPINSATLATQIIYAMTLNRGAPPMIAIAEFWRMGLPVLLPFLLHALAGYERGGRKDAPLLWMLAWITWLPKPQRDITSPHPHRSTSLPQLFRKALLKVLLRPLQTKIAYKAPPVFFGFIPKRSSVRATSPI